MSGFVRWARNNPGWQVAVFDGEPAELTQAAQEWRGDGMVLALDNDSVNEATASREFPVVTLGRFPHNHASAAVLHDDTACGQLAADHFLDRGFRHFGFVGAGDADRWDGVALGFVNRATSQGGTAAQIDGALKTPRELGTWLREQPRPLAILASSDRRAASVLEACQRAGLAVPGQVAVLGMGNHAPLCDLCTPTLSSLDCNPEARGFEAASLLSRLMDGERPADNPVRIPPAGVVERESTNTYALHDAELGKALRYIHENAHRSIKVQDVLTATSISRRSLENRFRRFFRRSLHEEIWRAHFERAKLLLTTTDLGLQQVADRSGFRTASALANLFKQKTGLTPRTYRARHRR